MNPSLLFEIGCLACEHPLALRASTVNVAGTRAVATATCTHCNAEQLVTVTLEQTAPPRGEKGRATRPKCVDASTRAG